MSNYCIRKTRIQSLKLPKGYERDKIIIGIPVKNNEDAKVGLKNIGDTVLPSSVFGKTCEKNAYGYFYTDKTQPKQNRYVATIWIQPWGNDYASPVPADIYRDCYPKVEVPPTEIEFSLTNDKLGNKYIVAILTQDIRSNKLEETVNMFLEIFGFCYIYSDDLEIDTAIRHRCNWEILPPGEKPSIHLQKQLQNQGKNTDTFDVDRLKTLEKYKVEQIVEGINGFNGYYAYVFSSICVLESAIYGNATYIIPKNNWEQLSQKTKKELLDSKQVIYKIVHTEKWNREIRQVLKKLEQQ